MSLNNVPAGRDVPNDFNVIIEIPMNADPIKYEVDKDTGAIFVDKARNVQAAGAIGMIVADNAPGSLTGLSGSDPSIRIPSVRVTQADGMKLRSAIQNRWRNHSGVIASLGINRHRLAGADERHRILMYTPNPNQPGSSVSHYTTDAKPNQLMEPAINADLTHTVTPPRDLTFPLLQDIGW
jgi:hypothetical protein